MSRRITVLSGIAPVLLAAAACQAIKGDTPTEPTPTASLSPIAIPVILPKPLPTPTPAPTPKPTPTPTPVATPEPTPVAGSCSLPPSNPANPSCTDESPLLFGDVDKALNRTVQAHPEYFDLNDKKCDNCYFVKNVAGYVTEVERQLSALGVCSYWDGEELAVKDSNGYSEQYDILLASGHMRRGVGSYKGICRPSWF
jgi:hypothetical protein